MRVFLSSSVPSFHVHVIPRQPRICRSCSWQGRQEAEWLKGQCTAAWPGAFSNPPCRLLRHLACTPTGTPHPISSAPPSPGAKLSLALRATHCTRLESPEPASDALADACSFQWIDKSLQLPLDQQILLQCPLAANACPSSRLGPSTYMLLHGAGAVMCRCAHAAAWREIFICRCVHDAAMWLWRCRLQIIETPNAPVSCIAYTHFTL